MIVVNYDWKQNVVRCLRVGDCYLEVLPKRVGVVASIGLVLLGVLPGVTWCYLVSPGVLPGRYLA